MDIAEFLTKPKQNKTNQCNEQVADTDVKYICGQTNGRDFERLAHKKRLKF
ncbi:MAG: hypothetical protein FWH37_09140 [Candidatus Bathyarchaeota archaeon]|nr:hypothetical protein [Candidatus Termiticorpusculum sp.]